jgi:hypothetical protein
MTSYAVARLEEIEELTDGREPFRPVRHHFGITSFGVNAWTAPEVGDRIINEHDESDRDSDEELYLVVRGRAMFELDGDRVAAPTGTFIFAPPGVKRTAFAEEPETTVIALGGTPGKAYEPDGWELWAPLNPLYEQASTPRRPIADANWSRLIRSTPGCSTTSPVARASRAGRVTRSITSDSRSTTRSGVARTQRMIRTSI